MYNQYLETVDAEDYEQMFGWPLSGAPKFDVVLGDMFAIEWHQADMVFANSTCFDITMMETIY